MKQLKSQTLMMILMLGCSEDDVAVNLEDPGTERLFVAATPEEPADSNESEAPHITKFNTYRTIVTDL